MPEGVVFIDGKRFTDARGNLDAVNDFSFEGICRFYQIRHSSPAVIRAWQGHKMEHKYFYVAEGSFVIAWVKVDNFDNPSPGLVCNHAVLSADQPGVLSIPAGFANGIKALSPESILTVYSNLDLRESEQDRWSYDSSLWMDWSKFK
jgi:dTDP-4-dehydrorhamnose 3,5-epimerase-like enzyme